MAPAAFAQTRTLTVPKVPRIPGNPGDRVEARTALVALEPSSRQKAPAGGVWNEDGDDSRFYRGHLLPRVHRQFGQLGQYRWTAQTGLPLSENILQEDVTRAARKSLERATQRALEDYVLEETSLRFVVDSLNGRRQGTAGKQRAARPVRFDLGISHGRPEVELRARLAGGGDVRFEIALDGEFGVAYRTLRTGRAAISARFDPSGERILLDTRLSF